MAFAEWRRTVWPTLPAEIKQRILAEVRSLRADGGDMEPRRASARA